MNEYGLQAKYPKSGQYGAVVSRATANPPTLDGRNDRSYFSSRPTITLKRPVKRALFSKYFAFNYATSCVIDPERPIVIPSDGGSRTFYSRQLVPIELRLV